jgi:2-polyprenyl-3-methyl-5-hydroxy-6-metoxy-1,4-benzoquinol methylase
MSESRCWVCERHELRQVKASNLKSWPDPDDFRITNSDYGRTATIYRCEGCGFLQCSDLGDVLNFYADMDDPGYEETRAERSLRARKLLQMIAPWTHGGRLLDVGAGTGILVEQAAACGFEASGVEPSTHLQRRAVEKNLTVYHGVLPHAQITDGYDVVTLVDVIEHVENPVEILREIRCVLRDDGIGCAVTPDVDSVAARLMGQKWWHYRAAHIGYFNQRTLSLALGNAGLRSVKTLRPGWYFPASYLITRLFSYLPVSLRPPVPSFLDRFTVPLNLYDSLLVVFDKK